MTREIVLDTETTGFDPYDGHRIVEIGCVELDNMVPTGRHLHIYLNPERDVPQEAVAVHGLTAQFLSGHRLFAERFIDVLDFIEGAQLVIHNAEFDMKFLNYELKTVGHPGLKNKVIDTLVLSREKFPGSPATLDALCRRFNIDNSGRELHGALLDSQLLAEVYLEIMGGRQHGLGLAETIEIISDVAGMLGARERKARVPRVHLPDPMEVLAHGALLRKLTDPIWKDYLEDEGAETPLP